MTVAGARALRIGSLCTGYGGLDMAVEAVYGGSVAWVSDIEPGPCALAAHHWPDVPNLGDLTTVDFGQVEPVDVLTAGYPCQPFSHAGQRKGTDDERHIWPHIRDAIGVLRPGRVVLENVAGHLSLGGPAVIADLAGLGYDARWLVVRAADVGACHRRARWFCVATGHAERPRTNTRPALSGSRHPVSEPSLPTPRTSDAIGVGGHGTGGPDLRTVVANTHGGDRQGRSDVAERGTEERAAVRRDCEGFAADAGSERRPQATRSAHSCEGSVRSGSNDHVAGSDAASGSADGRVDEQVAADTAGERRPGEVLTWPHMVHDGLQPAFVGEGTVWGIYGPAIERHAGAVGRPAPSPTDSKNRLAAEFVEWMMMLPAGWVTSLGLSRTTQLKLLGNGVVPPQAEHAIRILEAA